MEVIPTSPNKYSYLVRFTDLRGESRKRCKRREGPDSQIPVES